MVKKNVVGTAAFEVDKRTLTKKVERRKWCRAIGTESSDLGLRIVLAVDKDFRELAEKLVASLNLSTPVRVRILRELRLREGH